MKTTFPLCAMSAVLASVALALFGGCDEDLGRFIPNKPPDVWLTATPPDSGTAGYDIEFYWEGWDSDGEVDYFIYAVDPPDMYGPQDSVWTRTDDYSGRFVFKASDFDTLYSWRQSQIAKSWHVFVIKAVDDMGAVSAPDYVAFNATTIAPRTQFKTPPPGGGVQQYMGVPQGAGLRVTFSWDGDDPDGIFTKKPVGYYFKAVDVTGETNWVKLAAAVWNDSTEWSRRGPEDRKVVLDLDTGRAYAIAVRAVDEAGAVEPLLLLNGNMMWVAARQRESFPELSVRSVALGQRTWQGWSTDTETYEVPLGSIYDFTLSGNADWYGGLITGFSYGWDLDQLDSSETDPNGKGAWTPWSTARTTVRAQFDEERDYFLYVRCKDDGGDMTLATLQFHIIQLSPTKNLCYIDDWRKYPKYGVTGEVLDDQVWQTMLAGYNYGEDWADVSWDEWEAPYLEPMPTLEFLSQFRVVVWSLNDTRSTALSQQSAWYSMNRLSSSNVLALYMTRGIRSGERGKVWAFGRGLVESSLLGELGIFCDYPFVVDDDRNLDPDCGIRKDTFATQFMHITGEFNGSNPSSGGTEISVYVGYSDRAASVFVDTAGPAIPKELYTRPPAAELYPNLPPALAANQDWVTRSVDPFEVLDYPNPNQEHEFIFYDPVAGQMTGLIPLYRMHSRNTSSGCHNKYCGFRYIPSEPTDPGEIVYFLFPMFPFNDQQIRATAKVVLSDWFGLPDPDGATASTDRVGFSGAGARP
jgi:hypothetical protein